MHEQIIRSIESDFFERLIQFPVVAVLGAKQAGKTIFIHHVSGRMGTIRYFNLKKWEHLKELYHSEAVFKTSEKVTFCLDNIQLAPELLLIIGSLIRTNATAARFVLVSDMNETDFLRGLSLAENFVTIFSLSGLTIKELFHPTDFSINRHWLRGGFPESYFATSDTNSAVWREHYLKAFIENDGVKLGICLSGMQMHRLLNLFAQNQSECLNASKIANIFQMTHPTIRRYAEILEQAHFIRLLKPYSGKTKKRIVKTPKIYIRDSGMLHRLLSIYNMEDLRESPLRLASWKGYVIENILATFSEYDSCFYELASGSCLDLILLKPKQKIAVKIALSTSAVTDNFLNAIETLQPDHTYLVLASSAAQKKEYGNVTVCELPELIEYIQKIDRPEISIKT